MAWGVDKYVDDTHSCKIRMVAYMIVESLMFAVLSIVNCITLQLLRREAIVNSRHCRSKQLRPLMELESFVKK